MFNQNTMSLLLGTCTYDEANKFAKYLISEGYILEIFPGEDQFRAFKNGVEITEFEWLEALCVCGIGNN